MIFRKSHYLLVCNKAVADSAVTTIVSADNRIVVSEPKAIKCNRNWDRFLKFVLRRDDATVLLGVSSLDSIDGNLGPQEHWIFIDAPFSFFKKNVQLASDVKAILESVGAKE
jgi:hypothetical protein